MGMFVGGSGSKSYEMPFTICKDAVAASRPNEVHIQLANIFRVLPSLCVIATDAPSENRIELSVSIQVKVT